MCDGNDPDEIFPRHINDLEAVFASRPEFAVIEISLKRISVGVIFNFLESVFDFFNEFCDDLVRERLMEEVIGLTIKLDVGRLD
jgi:hypothetical protein